MATVALTPRGIAALKPGSEAWDAVVPGLHVRVGERRTTYYLRYRLHGKQRRYKLGTHPALTLAKAREEARDAIRRVGKGEDPAGRREEERKADLSFRAMAREVLDFKAEPDEDGKPRTREATRKERERILATELLPEWGSRLASSITRRDVVLLVDRIAARGHPVMANRTLALTKMLFNCALAERAFPGVEANPAALLKPRKEKSRPRYLDKDEMRTLWRTLDSENATTQSVFRFTWLTAQRVGSVMKMKWADVDPANVWRIPAADFKGDREMWVPLSAEALAVLEVMKPISGEDEYVFPGRGGKHMASVNKALQRIRRDSGLEHFTIHDARRCFRTWAVRPVKPENPSDPAGLGIAPYVADACLGHKDLSLGTVRYTGDAEDFLLSEKRQAMEAWGRFVAAAVAEGRA